MPHLPAQVKELRDAINGLKGVVEAEVGIQSLEDVDVDSLSLPGEFGDLPHVAIRRTNGGRKGEALVTARVTFSPDRAGWIALEFLAWWVRDLSRGGEEVQMRPVALPPKGYDTQLGATLRCLIEFFFIDEARDASAVLPKLEEYAEGLTESIDSYRQQIGDPADFPFERRTTVAGYLVPFVAVPIISIVCWEFVKWIFR